MAATVQLLLLTLLSLLVSSALAKNYGNKTIITYDARSLILNGNRDIFFSGSIHYPRMPVEMWPEIIQKAKEGGLNVIDTYVFWNIHEPVQGQWNFEGNYDLVKFVKLVADNGLYVILRVGPYIEAEWNAGGFPYWLREIPGVLFRTYNEPFMFHMKRYTEKIVNMMKEEKLFAPQGGPIILAQIENEYNNVALAYRENGIKYIKWAADMAVGLYNEIPWIMCKGNNAITPDNVINTCNGRHCGDTFPGPNGPNKPTMWTENWTAQYRVFGDPPSQRAAEDLAFAVARFFSAKGGSLANYYMYYGGTNYGRTGSSFVTTRYYDEAPLDEFGLLREPKYGHLRDLHKALRLSKKALLWGTRNIQKPRPDIEIITFEKPGSDICAAFLTNNLTKLPAMINFRGKDYQVPPKSITILPDCKTVAYNTQKIVAQHNSRAFHPAENSKDLKWEMFREKVPTVNELPLKNREPLELYSLTKDASDYAWYSTSITFDRRDLPMREDILPVLQVVNLGHAMLAYVNGEYVGFGRGDNIEKKFLYKTPISLKPGVNHITLLGMTVGFPNSGAYMEKRFAGPRAITIQGLNAGTLDVTLNNWAHEVGISGEKNQVFTEEGSKKVQWTPAAAGPGGPMTWYKTYFDAPEGNGPVALRMTSMGKGMIWINGKSIGRHWSSYLSAIKKPSQSEYHIPRAFLKPKGNLFVVLEEIGGNPGEIEILTVNRDTICSYVSDNHPPSVLSWERAQNQFRAVGEGLKTGAQLTCPEKKKISQVEFANYGDPWGACGSYHAGNCSAPHITKAVEQLCLGKNSCAVPLESFQNVKDACPPGPKTLAIQVRCGKSEKHHEVIG